MDIEEPRRSEAVGDVARTELDVGARAEFEASAGGRLELAGADRERLRGVTIGRYVLLTELGEGGMGVVWAAYDPELDRRLALKVLRRAGDSDRLLREAQALARLSHPNVVAIHDVGEDGGEVWLAMELVEGRTLAAWCEADRARSWREVLAVVLPAGHGVAAAHRAGLIHRDLKPDNVMVGEDGRARVMDFGLARAGELVEVGPAPSGDPLAMTDSSLLTSSVTRAGAIVGTPLYMAPEQFAGAVDERSDLFAFCVVLWEALYGARPFAAENLVGMVYAITQGNVQEGPRGRSVPRWLRRVLLRGLEGSPEARWQTMEELLAAIEGGLARERWRRLAIVLALVGVVALGVVAWGLIEDRRLRSACAAEAASIEELWPGQAPEALAAIHAAGIGNADETAAKLGPVLDRWAEGWAESREASCLGEVGEGGERGPELTRRALDCSDLQRSELEGLLEVLGGGEEGVALRTVEAALALSEPSECLDLAYLRELTRPDPERRDAVNGVLGRLRRAKTMLRLAKHADAEALAEAAKVEAEGLGWPPLLATAEVTFGQTLLRGGRYAEAEEQLRRGLGDALAVGDERLAIMAIYHLGYVAHEQKKAELGLVWLDTADGLLRRLGAERGLLGTRILGIRAVLYIDTGELAKSSAIYDELLPLVDELLGDESWTAMAHLNNAALLRVDLGDAIGAREMHLRVQRKREAILGPNHPLVAGSLLNRGLTHMRADEFDLARPLFEQALAIDERVYGADNPHVARTLNVLSVTLSELGQFEEATRLGERVLALREATFGADHLEYASALNNHGVSLAEQGRFDEARALHQRALEIRQAHFGDEGNEVARSHTNLGELAIEVGDVAAAIEHLERAVELREAIEVSPVSLAYSRFALARAVATLDPARAEELATLALGGYAAAEHKRVAEVQAWIDAHAADGRRTKRSKRSTRTKRTKNKKNK